jgi:hypothetical protein
MPGAVSVIVVGVGRCRPTDPVDGSDFAQLEPMIAAANANSVTLA